MLEENAERIIAIQKHADVTTTGFEDIAQMGACLNTLLMKVIFPHILKCTLLRTLTLAPTLILFHRWMAWRAKRSLMNICSEH